ncbi:MAG TPA: ABC transporter substrate-binding protein, partial [Actinoplanes sp.]|nr:ABC transporter substrate-binding protein [Actinoplanes sp.]
MRVSKRVRAAAICAVVALVAAGCSGDDGGAAKVATADAGIVIENVNPQNPLVPAITNETGGGKIIGYLWTGLVAYPNDGGAPTPAVAESIETTDSKVFTIKIKPGTKFHDGTEVKAENFVDAWNWAAYSPNGATTAGYFDKIAGYADVHPEDPDADGPKQAPTPKSKTMSGLQVLDDHTFRVTLSAPFAIFPAMLGYNAFVPMPDVFFTSTPAEFGRRPIGNGPVKFVSWQDNVEINLTRFDDYVLPGRVKIKDVKVKIFTKDPAAYQELRSGTLDFQRQVPVAALADGSWRKDLPGERTIEANVPATQILAFPTYDKRFANPKLRAAISMAIDRQQIADKIFFGTRVPATSWANPLTPGDVPNNCTVCRYDPAAAKAALAEAGGFTGELVLYYNAD